MGRLAGRLLSLPHAKQVSHHELVFTERSENEAHAFQQDQAAKKRGSVLTPGKWRRGPRPAEFPGLRPEDRARSAPTGYRGGRAIGELMYADWITQDLLETILKYKDIWGF